MPLRLNLRYVRFAAFVIFLLAVTYLTFTLSVLVGVVFELAILTLLGALTLDPLVRWLEAYGSPRWSAVIVTILFFVLVVVFLVWYLIPPFVVQFRQLLQALPAMWDTYQAWLDRLAARYPGIITPTGLQDVSTQILLGVQQTGVLARSILASTVGIVAGLLLVIVATVYSLLNPWPLLLGLRGLFPYHWWGTIEHLATAIAQRIQGWILGTIALGFTIGVLDYLGLLFVNLIFGPDIPFILFFAIIGGLLEVIPVIGPVIAGILPTLVALSIDPYMALTVVIVYVIIQQLENHIAAPLIMQKAVELHPVTIIFTLAAMAALFGIFGALIAVPVASTIKIIYRLWYYPLLHNGDAPLPTPVPHDMSVRIRREWRRRQHARQQQRQHSDGS